MTLNPSNSSNLEQLALKGLRVVGYWRKTFKRYTTAAGWCTSLAHTHDRAKYDEMP